MSYQSDFWNKYFLYYDILLKVIPYQELFSKIVIALNLKKGLKLLDVGAGTGNLQHFINENLDTISLDYSDEALNRLKSKYPNADVIKHNIFEKFPYPENHFDRIVANNVLYTLRKEEWKTVLLELNRISKPGSIIVISNLNENFKAINIYKDHIKKSLRIKGVFKTIWELSTLIYPTIQMINYNRVINSQNEKKVYSFLKPEEQKRIFQELNFQSLKETDIVYSDQAYLNVFKNIKSS